MNCSASAGALQDRQERGVIQPVKVAQPVVEVQAVKDSLPVVGAEDVVSEQRGRVSRT